jgi:hypothetical protein
LLGRPRPPPRFAGTAPFWLLDGVAVAWGSAT